MCYSYFSVGIFIVVIFEVLLETVQLLLTM